MNTVHDSLSHRVSCKRRRKGINKHGERGNATPGDSDFGQQHGGESFRSEIAPGMFISQTDGSIIQEQHEYFKTAPNFHGHSAADLTSHPLCCFFFFLFLGIVWNVNFLGMMWRLNRLSRNPRRPKPIRFTALSHYLQLSAINFDFW